MMRSNLTLRHFEAIIAIADNGSFVAAAERLHVSQPALSRTVRIAEDILGVQLFDRGQRNATPTAAGKELLTIARRVNREFHDSLSELSQFIEGRRGRVRVSSLPSMVQPFLLEAVARFRALHPGVEFLVRSDPADLLMELVENSEVDVGLTVPPPPDGRFDFVDLHEDEFVLVCRADDPIALSVPPDRAVGWQVFEDREFIAATAGSNTRDVTDAAFTRLGLNIRPTHEVAGNLPFIGGMVAAGLGISVLPASALSLARQTTLVARRLASPVMQRRIGLLTLAGRTLSSATALFCQHLERSGARETVAARRKPRTRAAGSRSKVKTGP